MGCANGADCPDHGRRAQRHRYNQHRGSPTALGYGTPWTRYRSWYFDELERQQGLPICGARLPGAPETTDSRCASHGWVTRGRYLDHIRPATGPDDPAFFDPANHQLLCASCHDAKRQRESQAGRR